ncbi:DNA polymerase III subunit epsilon [bacterium]|nr:DNA polymerase III subunit epsilon [bacterium]
MRGKREIALDTETTGLEPEEGHRIVEIGCVEMIDGIRTGNTFHKYLNPQRDMPEEAQRIHGLSSDFLKDKPTFKQVVKEFVSFIGNAPLVIHNAAFDMKFLNAELINAKHPPLPGMRAIDTLMMAKRMFPGSPSSLDALCKRFNIDLGKRVYHGALLDAELLADIYLELTGGKQNSLWQDETGNAADPMLYIPAADMAAMATSIIVIEPTEEEKANHLAFIKGVKQAIWLDYFPQESQSA